MERFNTQKAEIMRIKSFYRQLILEGRVDTSHESIKKLIGPDCVFHLYRIKKIKSTPK